MRGGNADRKGGNGQSVESALSRSQPEVKVGDQNWEGASAGQLGTLGINEPVVTAPASLFPGGVQAAAANGEERSPRSRPP